MSETRVRVYRTPGEYVADRDDAAAHGWTVSASSEQPDGTLRVWYAHTGRRRVRVSSALIVGWCLLMLLWAVAAVNAQADCAGTYADACRAGETIGRGIAVTFVGFVWFAGFAVLSLVWFATRPRH